MAPSGPLTAVNFGMVVMTHNTDIADSWEREGEDPAFFYQFSPDGYAVGVNVLLHAMTH